MVTPLVCWLFRVKGAGDSSLNYVVLTCNGAVIEKENCIKVVEIKGALKCMSTGTFSRKEFNCKKALKENLSDLSGIISSKMSTGSGSLIRSKS